MAAPTLPEDENARRLKTVLLEDFAQDLGQLRKAAGLSYTQLAAHAFQSKTSLYNADHGKTFPTWEVTAAYLTACGEDDHQPWKRRWARVAVALGRRDRRPHRSRHANSADTLDRPPPDPNQATTVAHFIDSMSELRSWSGMTYRAIAVASECLPRRIPTSTLSDLLTHRVRLPDEPLLASFLIVCGLNHDDQQPWFTTAHRLRLGTSEPPATHHDGNQQWWTRRRIAIAALATAAAVALGGICGAQGWMPF
ncbi:helix-turn-helix protein [Asanoa ferruginea]|uniref:Helix-turn-helix protein n=1 Tax=Asanoa ferruginea TaxID=53367 RepID=A0A3E0A3Q5_9ACTN|nr:helix-turn-helix transcriptional regulator [Asanoa ferruginea]REG00931.1 helix-turn-helix protein [Asanoa ferruginea]GIF47515.1 hypothetical protein Afe04nite_20540 [Asanoa ferruginea]